MPEPLAYLNGAFLPLAQAGLPLSDGGFLNGATVTDNCRTWHGQLFRWADHQARFRRDCQDCHIPLPVSDDEITAIAERLLPFGSEVHVVPFATPQSFGMFMRPVDQARNQRFHEQGVELKVVGHQPADGDAILPPRIKHRSRMVWHIAQSRAGDVLAVLLDRPGGTLTETAIACVVAVIDGRLVTPPRGMILESITLKVAMELAANLGIDCDEREIRRTDWEAASELILAGTGFGLARVKSIDEHTLPGGPVFDRLAAAWNQAVATRN